MKKDTNYKYHQKEWDKSNGNTSPTARSIRRSQKIKFDKLREIISDKIWFDSLSMDEKESVHSYWFFMYKNFQSRPNWFTWTRSPNDEDTPSEDETTEDYCKRMVPGCKNTQRDLKLNKILN